MKVSFLVYACLCNVFFVFDFADFLHMLHLIVLCFSFRIRPMPIHPGQSQQYIMKPKYYHRHTTHTQTHVQTQPERPIPLTVGHNPNHGE